MELIIHGMKSTVNRICRDEETVFVADWIYFSLSLSLSLARSPAIFTPLPIF